MLHDNFVRACNYCEEMPLIGEHNGVQHDGVQPDLFVVKQTKK